MQFFFLFDFILRELPRLAIMKNQEYFTDGYFFIQVPRT